MLFKIGLIIEALVFLMMLSVGLDLAYNLYKGIHTVTWHHRKHNVIAEVIGVEFISIFIVGVALHASVGTIDIAWLLQFILGFVNLNHVLKNNPLHWFNWL